MLSFAMILTREMIAARSWLGGEANSRSSAVDAIAHDEAVLQRLDMDVGGAALDRARDELIDQADDRHFAGEIAQPVDILEQILVGADFLASSATCACGVLLRSRKAAHKQHRNPTAARSAA